MTRESRQAFSLPEVVVVLGIVLLTISIMLPVVSQTSRSARALQCQSQLRQIGQAIHIYANDNRGRLIPYDRRRFMATYVPWRELLFESQLARVVVCPTGIDIEYQSYILNIWLHAYDVRLGQRLNRSSSDVVLAGENTLGENEEYSLPHPRVTHERFRHGRSLRSNYLWLDSHVSNEDPVSSVKGIDPWYVRPAGWLR